MKIICVSVLLLISAASMAETLNFDASLGTLPTDQGFDAEGVPTAFIEGDALRLGPTDVAGSEGYKSESISFDFTDPGLSFSMSWEVQVLFSSYLPGFRGGYAAGAFDGSGRRFFVWIGSDAFVLVPGANTSSPDFELDLTDQFHTFRLIVDSGEALLYLDGSAKPALRQQINTFTGSTTNQAFFGDGTLTGNSETLTRYFSYTNNLCADGDYDFDGVENSMDNCLMNPNPDQVDLNGDGFGNACDEDINDDGQVNFLDLSIIQQSFLSTDSVADINADGVVNFLDLARFSQNFLGTPGPSCVMAVF